MHSHGVRCGHAHNVPDLIVSIDGAYTTEFLLLSVTQQILTFYTRCQAIPNAPAALEECNSRYLGLPNAPRLTSR